MNLSLKVRTLNLFRNVFKIPLLESFLASMTAGKLPTDLICKLVPNPYQYAPGTFKTITRNGITMRLDVSDYLGHFFFFGFLDIGMKRLFSLCQENDNVLDVGANIGWTALNFAQLAKNGKVLGFEPDAYNFERCIENISLNNFKNLSVFQLGVGDHPGKIGMEVRSAANRAGNRIAPQPSGTSQQVEIIKLDDFPPMKELAKVDLIKIDVEGYELHVLRGAQNLLKQQKPTLFIELDDNNLKDQGDSAEALIGFLIHAGYRSIVHAENNEPITMDLDFNNCHFDIIVK